ncbi:response regulator receiver protein [Richelia sinica FACHB-800]|uniref:Protein PatA n=1 Tax=Richelia sinica FACHB-800 TaxID=1357546 RepID=A0A975TC69_9NOST|nr:response regulator [Richelia sinica]MBD2664588.1 response regulator [Richelia sinica FACHB-800]QXE25211.1 response regulator receiver protein [Richelia sinica FACHB-800]
MNNVYLFTSNHLFKELDNLIQLQYSGKLEISNSKKHNWCLYFIHGQIIWATGGTQACRRLRRHLVFNIYHLKWQEIVAEIEDLALDYWDYLLIGKLYKQNRISQVQTKSIVENIIREVLFNLAQNIHGNNLIYQQVKDEIIALPINLTNANMFLKYMQESWLNWVKSGLTSISPDLVAVLRQPELLQQEVTPLVYKNLERLINGQNSLWDLSVTMKQNVLQITRSLLPFIRQGIVELITVPDIRVQVNSVVFPQKLGATNQANLPLIACVDDSPQICKTMEQIISGKGLRFIGIHDSLQALPILIQNKPNLIFLDLIMPAVNGYEICSQLRKISIFAQTPIVILTGSDGVFDRMRSKVFGATEFISKPVDKHQVQKILNKYLSRQDTEETTMPVNLAFSY